MKDIYTDQDGDQIYKKLPMPIMGRIFWTVVLIIGIDLIYLFIKHLFI